MRLSEIKGDRCFEVIADLVAPVSNIAQDEKAVELFKRRAVPEGKTPKEFFIERMRNGLPALMKDHKQDFVAIIATLDGTTPEEYTENLNLAKLFGDFIGLLTDEEFMTFLS